MLAASSITLIDGILQLEKYTIPVRMSEVVCKCKCTTNNHVIGKSKLNFANQTNNEDTHHMYSTCNDYMHYNRDEILIKDNITGSSSVEVVITKGIGCHDHIIFITTT